MTDRKNNIFEQMIALNKEGKAPTQVHLLPLGKILGRDGREFFLKDINQVIKNSISRFNPTANSSHLDLVIDYVSLNKKYNELQEKLSTQEAETAINKAVEEGRLMPALKDNALAIHKAQGQKALEDFISKFPTTALNKSETPASAPKTTATSVISVEEKAICKQIGLSEEDYRKAKELENASV